MNKKPITKDELFLLKLYEMASSTGDLYSTLSIKEVGQAINMNDKRPINIVRHLAQANFVKKDDDGNVSLRENGTRLAEKLIQERL